MTHKQALIAVDAILNAENTTWQEKKNRLADFVAAADNNAVFNVMFLLRSKMINSSMTNKEIIQTLNEYKPS